jgi:hypothetical protein
MGTPTQLQRALEAIKGTIWAVVYSFQAADDRRARWYDRWRYDIINDYVEAVSLLGCEPLICDADLYAQVLEQRGTQVKFAINLNSSARPLSNAAYVPALSAWHNIPCFPNSADALIIGERKDASKYIASRFLKIPETLPDEAPRHKAGVFKPVDGGNSRDVEIIGVDDPRPDPAARGSVFDSFMLEEYVPGPELTIPVYRSGFTGQVIACPPVIYELPTKTENWIYSHDQKLSPAVRLSRQIGRSSPQLRLALAQSFNEFGIQHLGRFDFRAVSIDADFRDKDVSVEDVVFLEVNTHPTLRRDVNFLRKST